MSLIVLLILSEDDGFNKAVHQIVSVAHSILGKLIFDLFFCFLFSFHFLFVFLSQPPVPTRKTQP